MKRILLKILNSCGLYTESQVDELREVWIEEGRLLGGVKLC